MPTIQEIPNDGGNPPAIPRFHLSEDMKRDAKGAVKTVVEGLSLAASMTQNVPYLGIVSGALTAFMKIQDEVGMLKSDWKLVMDIARQMQANLDYVRERVKGRGDDALPEDLVEPLAQLEKCLATALKTINACKADSKSLADRARLYLNRGELSGEVRQCREAMKAALDFFNTRVNVINMFALDKLVEKHVMPTAAPALIISSARLPPPAPGIFYGRAHEVDHILDLVLHHAPARAAILGPGGIGKTSIALTVLHHPDVKMIYANRRFFVSCETVTSTEGVVLELLTAFGLVHDPRQGIIPQQLLLNYLQGLSDGILCMDNIETLWDVETRATEDLLVSLASFPQLALLVTTRGSRRPMHVVWTQPFLPPIMPLSLDAALQAWDAICEVHDEYAVNLIEAVDCMPLAVALLANLATGESPKVLWERWENENLEVLRPHNFQDRLSSIEYSVELSLRGPRLQNEAATVRVLQILCMLPQGLLEARMPAFTEAFLEILPGFTGSISLLKQCSLVYTSETGFIRVLAPIRHHMQTHYSLPTHFVHPLATIYCDLVDHDTPGHGAMNFPYAQDMIRPEMGNISAILMHLLTCQFESSQEHFQRTVLWAILFFTKLCQTFSFGNIKLLDHAINVAQDYFPDICIELLEVQGLYYYHSDRPVQAISAYSQAIDIGRDFSPEMYAWVLMQLGDAYYFHGEYGRAKSSLQLAVSTYEGSGSFSSDQLHCKVYLGRVYVGLGELRMAEGILKSVYQAVMESDSQINKANCAQFLGELYLAKNVFDWAEKELLFSLELSEEYHGILGKANVLLVLGLLYIETRDYDRAAHVLQLSKGLLETIGSKSELSTCLRVMGQLHTRLGQFIAAEDCLRSAMRLHDTIDARHDKVPILYSLGDLLYRLGQYDEARSKLESAIEMSSAMPYPLGHGEALFCLAKVHQDCDEPQEALPCFREAIKQFERAEDPRKAQSVIQELDELVARLRATGGYISPATTEGSMESTRTGSSADDDDGEDWHSAVGSEPEGSVREMDKAEAGEEVP